MLDQVVGEVVKSLGDGQAHGGAQDTAGLTGQTLRGLAQQFESGVGEQGVGAAGGLERVLDELGEALAGLISTEAPIPEKRKRRLMAVALIDVLLNVFFMFFLIALVVFFVISFVISGESPEFAI